MLTTVAYLSMIYYITTSFDRSFIIVFITSVSYTDIEIEFEPSEEEITDSVGKLKENTLH